MSSSKYVLEAVSNVEKYLLKNRPDLKLPKKAATPYTKDYRPEIDVTNELGAEDENTADLCTNVLDLEESEGKI